MPVPYQHRRLMPAIAVGYSPFFSIDNCVKKCDKLTFTALTADHFIKPARNCLYGLAAAFDIRISPHGTSKTAHHKRSRHPFTHHIGNRHRNTIVTYCKKIVKVTAHIKAWNIRSRYIQTRYLRRPFRNHLSLNKTCQPHLLGHMCAFNRLRIQPGVGYRNRTLRSNRPGKINIIFIKALRSRTVKPKHTNRLAFELHRNGKLADKTLFDCSLFIFDPVIETHIVQHNRLACKRGFNHGIIFRDHSFAAVFFAESVGASHFQIAGLFIQQPNRAGLDPDNLHRRLGQLIQHLLKRKLSGHQRGKQIYQLISFYLFLCLFRHNNVNQPDYTRITAVGETQSVQLLRSCVRKSFKLL